MRLLAAIALLSLAATTGAQAAPLERSGQKDRAWSGSVGLGFLQTSGNLESQSLNGDANVTYERLKWRHKGTLETLFSSERGETTSERYLASGKSDYKFDERRYAFAYLKYEKDHFSGYEYQLTASLGYGARLLDTAAHTLDLEGGPGFRRNRLRDSGDQAGQSQDITIGRAALDYLWSIGETSRFGEELSVEAGDEATITKSVTSISTRVAGALATKITYTARHASHVPEGFARTNTETAVTLVYEF